MFFFDTEGFLPRGTCGPGWPKWLIYAYFLSDLVIWFSYMMIPILLVYLARSRKDIPFRYMFILFSIFIVGCGLTHLMGAIEFLVPIYHTGVTINIITAIASLSTAIVAYGTIKEALKLKSPKEFENLYNRYRAVIDSTAEGIIIFDTTPKVLEVNKGAELMFGYKESELIGTNMIFIDVPENTLSSINKLDEMKLGSINERYRIAEDKLLLRKDGSIFDAAVSMSQLCINGNVLYVMVIRDVSIRKHLEREKELLSLTINNRVKTFEQFNFMLVHDLNAPLRSIEGFSEILDQDFKEELGEQGADYTRRIKIAVKHMRKLINDMLHLSRIMTADITITRTSTNLTAIANTIGRNLADSNSKPVDFIVHPNMIINCDTPLIELALGNLLENAWKFSSKKDSPKIEVGSFIKNNEVVYYVRDNGAGFDMKLYDKLFKPFSRLHSKLEFTGNGIGLFIVSRAILLHGGKVWAESSIGEGTTFYFTLGN